MLAPLYTEEVLREIERKEARRLDRKRLLYLARAITIAHCDNRACPMRENDHMRNKEIVLHTRTEWQSPQPYCVVTCKHCRLVMSPHHHMSLYRYTDGDAAAAVAVNK